MTVAAGRWNDRAAAILEWIAAKDDEITDGLNATLRRAGRDLIFTLDDGDEYRLTVRREPTIHKLR